MKKELIKSKESSLNFPQVKVTPEAFAALKEYCSGPPKISMYGVVSEAIKKYINEQR